MKSNMKRKWFIVLCFIIVLSIILIGCSNEGNVPPSNYTLYTVSGTIMDTDGNPMSNATLSFSGGFGTATTNVNGSWQKDSLKGNVTITPAKESWIFYPENYQVSGTEDNINFSANPEVTEELAQQFNQTANEVNNILENNYDPENKEESLAAAAEEVSSLPEVTEVESSDTSLIIKHKHGKREIWSSPPIPAKPVWAADLSQNVTELINESGNVSLPNNNDVVLPGNQKVLVIYAMDADPGFDEHD